jgi:hypothetical protein
VGNKQQATIPHKIGIFEDWLQQNPIQQASWASRGKNEEI